MAIKLPIGGLLMTWTQFKKEFRELIELHLYWYYLEFLKFHIIWDDESNSSRRAIEKDIPFKEFIRKSTMSLDNGINTTLHRLGYRNYPSYFDSNFIEFTIDSAYYRIYDNPFVLAIVYKKANRRQ